MKAVVTVTLWLMLGHAIAGGAYLSLIHTPESNVLMLAASVTLVLFGLTVLVWTSASAARSLLAGGVPWHGWGRVMASLPSILVAVLLGMRPRADRRPPCARR